LSPNGKILDPDQEGSWKFAAVASTSPARFEIPYEVGAVIEISGRAANVNNQEAAPDLCPLTQWPLGGGQADAGIAGTPTFALSAPGGGALTFSQVGFKDLANISSVRSGTLTLFAWNELLTPSPYTLAAPLTDSEPDVTLTEPSAFSIGDVLQIGIELITILSAVNDRNGYTVERAALGSSSTPHSAGDSVLLLTRSAIVVPFASGFFENRASQNFLHTVSMPDYRVCAAQFYVTNSFGESEANQTCYLSATETGLRTLSGGQFSLQVNGFIATQQNAAPPMIVESSHAVRDIRATLTQPSAGFTVSIDLLQNSTLYCSLEIASGSTSSESIASGLGLPPLVEDASLTMNVSVSPVQGFTSPPRPGRDLTVTIRL
jgi:hypothetical protein